MVFAVALGIDVLNLPRTNTGGVGSTSNVTYYAPLTVELGKGIKFTCQVGFTSGMDMHGFGLLGAGRLLLRLRCPLLPQEQFVDDPRTSLIVS
jgi:hypothetical protein